MDKDESELLTLLVKLCKRGPIVAQNIGSNAVGKTLQQELGIIHTTTKRNSLHNHTITATTSHSSSSRRTNLFACVPTWKLSTCKSSKELADNFGREDQSRGYIKSLFCTSSFLGPNGFGLFLKISDDRSKVEEKLLAGEVEQPVVAWRVSILEDRLTALGKTAIITALPVSLGNDQAFHFRYVDFLGVPNINHFLELIENGVITIDHCISIKNRNGKLTAREQGPLFKIRADARDELYGNIKRIDLMDY